LAVAADRSLDGFSGGTTGQRQGAGLRELHREASRERGCSALRGNAEEGTCCLSSDCRIPARPHASRQKAGTIRTVGPAWVRQNYRTFSPRTGLTDRRPTRAVRDYILTTGIDYITRLC